MTNERLEASVRGMVQGVGYRWFTVREARHLGLTGWVANEPDGSVRVVAEGPPAALAQLLRVLHQGPTGSRVRDVEEDRQPASGSFVRFELRPRGHAGD